MSGSWNDWLVGGYIGLAVYAIFYLLRKVSHLELQIRVLKSEDKRLSDSIDDLYALQSERDLVAAAKKLKE
jgi:hypothetical protein